MTTTFRDLGCQAIITHHPMLDAPGIEGLHRQGWRVLAYTVNDESPARRLLGLGLDGLITDAMKSLGAARKGGGAPVVDVLDYPEPVTKHRGVTLLCTPGSDVSMAENSPRTADGPSGLGSKVSRCDGPPLSQMIRQLRARPKPGPERRGGPQAAGASFRDAVAGA